MRTFCLFLILANALFLTWSQLIDAQINVLDRAPPRAAKPAPRIVLAHEAPSITPDPKIISDVQPPKVEPLNGTRSAPPVEVARADELSCTSVGPFADLPQASQAQAALRTVGFQPRQRVEQGELWVGYWVSVQNLGSREAAEAAVKDLGAGGITDVYLMPGTDPANILSLGVFSDYERAQRRADEVRALGLEPRIDDRKRAGSVYWIDVDLPEPGQAIDPGIFQTGPGKIMRIEMRPCPPSAAG